MTTVKTPFGVYKVPMGSDVDTGTLKTIADKTGGIFRQADDAKSLEAIYKEIGNMEKSEIESIRYIDYKENFLVFALLGLGLIVVEIFLSCTLFRKIP